MALQLAIYDGGDYETIQEAIQSGALYEMSSNWTYVDPTGLQDAMELVDTVNNCAGENSSILVVRETSGEWVEADTYLQAL